MAVATILSTASANLKAMREIALPRLLAAGEAHVQRGDEGGLS